MTDRDLTGPRPRGTPDDVVIRSVPSPPVGDPTLGIRVTASDTPARPRHRLVTIGDSLTHGLQSGAIFHTDLSYPAIIARELGFEPFRRPVYAGYGGFPLNLETLLRELEYRIGHEVTAVRKPLALMSTLAFMKAAAAYWRHGAGSIVPTSSAINHNLGIAGWDLRDALDKTAAYCDCVVNRSHRALLFEVPQYDLERAALRVYPTAASARSMTLFDAARQLGEETDDHSEPAAAPSGGSGIASGGSGIASGGSGIASRGSGIASRGSGIETLIVELGANNALRTVVDLQVRWSTSGYDDPEIKQRRRFTVWRPTHFANELAGVEAQVRTVEARHVIWCTVPHVTIAPIARGVGGKLREGSRYFRYYTRPWLTDRTFRPGTHPYLTGEQARAVDSAIDQYNEEIAAVVRRARGAGRDWYLMDLSGVLDRLAARRYANDPAARPEWWQPYELPGKLMSLDPPPDTRFLRVSGGERIEGGLFSLDGIHPTTVGYGIIAQELINIMQLAGVQACARDDSAPQGRASVDFERLMRLDTLLTDPPRSLTHDLGWLGWLGSLVDAGEALKNLAGRPGRALLSRLLASP